jgi:hypothetical protein
MSELGLIFYKTVKHHSHCLLCHSTYNLQFHHVEPDQKVSEVFKIASAGDLAATIRELNKCVPLCDPDHKAVHKGLIKGWLKGQFENGRQSDALHALPYMPYLNWMSRQKPKIFHDFYRDNIQSAHNVIWPFISDKPKSPRLRLVK